MGGLICDLEKGGETYCSSIVSCLPMLSLRTSGRYHTCSFCRKKSFAASRMIRGKVASPTHHQEARNLTLSQPLREVGSMEAPVEKTRATSLGWFLEEVRVMVLLIDPLPIK